MNKQKNLKAILVDDEANGRENLELLLRDFCPNVTVIAQAATIEEARKLIYQGGFDVAFLDIQIGSESIFKLLRELSKLPFQVIFVTAYNHFAVNAFEFMAIDYLLKPIDIPLLQRSVAKVGNRINLLNQEATMQQLLLQLNDLNRDQHKIAIPTNNGYDMLPVKEITYCLADGSYTHIYLDGQDKRTVSKNLKHYERLLSEYGFIRSHPSALINLQYIKSIERLNGGNLVMDDGEILPISKNKRLELEEVIRNNQRL